MLHNNPVINKRYIAMNRAQQRNFGPLYWSSAWAPPLYPAPKLPLLLAPTLFLALPCLTTSLGDINVDLEFEYAESFIAWI